VLNNNVANIELKTENHYSETNNPHNVTKIQLGLSNVNNIKHNLTSTFSPSNFNDHTEGYSVGSKWLDINNKDEYTCFNSYHNSALWKKNVGILANNGPSSYSTAKAFNSLFASKTTDDILEGTQNIYFSQEKVSQNYDIISNKEHRYRTDNPHALTKHQIGLSNLYNIKSNFNGANEPTLNNDSTEGYEIGSRWIDTVNCKEYLCVDSYPLNAQWKQTTIEIFDELNFGKNIGTGGIGIYKSTHDQNIILKKIDSGSNKIIVVDDVINDKINIDIVESNLDLNNIGGNLFVTKGGTGLACLPTGKFLQGNDCDQVLTEKDVPHGDVVGTTDTQNITNKNIDAIQNTIINLDNVNIKFGANIDIKKLGTGLIDINEFNTLSGIKNNIQEQFDNHLEDSFNPHKVTKEQIGLNHIINIKNTYSSPTYPKSYHDSLVGYSVGSLWIDTLHNTTYRCVNDAVNSAKWVQTSNTPGEINFGTNTGTGTGIYKNKIDSVMKFKSFVGGNNVALSTTNEEVIINSKNIHSFILASTCIDVHIIDFKPIFYFPWIQTEFNQFSNGKVIFGAIVANRGVIMRVFNRVTGSTLGETSVIDKTGTHILNIANPDFDVEGIIEIQLKKSEDGGINPQLCGVILKFDS
jgi:hypothetical protein